MLNANFLNLYVEDLLESARFYEDLTGLKPLSLSPGYALFQFPSGIKLGLWLRSDVSPAAAGGPGASEICFQEESDAAVDERFSDWTSKGAVIAQPSTRMSFGYTFTAQDPDGHRLRVYRLSA